MAISNPPADAQYSPPTTEERLEPVSLWLYIAGAIAALAAIFSVNFIMDGTDFGTFAYGATLFGFTLSYYLRLRRTALKSLQIPIFVIVVLIIAAFASSDSGTDWLWPADVSGDRQKSVQAVLVWLVLLQSFLLSSNGAVLFTIVPCFAMLALVSQSTTEAEVQNAFLVFVGAATFLMVHENFLRTRAFQTKGRSEAKEKQLFGGQFQLAALCLFGALALANIVAVPLKTLGQTFFSPGNLNAFVPINEKSSANSSPNVQVSERNQVDLASGPVGLSDAVLMRVISSRGLYLRGTTFDTYTGTQFRNQLGTLGITLSPSQAQQTIQRSVKEYRGLGEGATSTLLGNRFRLEHSQLELPPSQMQGATNNIFNIRLVGGTFSQLYGATSITETLANIPNIEMQETGGLWTNAALPANFEYQVISTVADDDPDRLSRASSSITDIPEPIRRAYLARGIENDTLRQLAADITKDKNNNYDKVIALKEYIADTCKYNVQTPRAPRNRDIVEYFLLDAKMGYCDSFGASLVMLCRYANIPARLVSGFLPGELKDGVYLVREKHKHIWTEVFFPKIGWITFDATDGSEDVTDYNQNQQQQQGGFLQWLKGNGTRLLLGTLIVALVLFVLRNEILNRLPRRKPKIRTLSGRPTTNIEIATLYVERCNRLKRIGLPRPPALTPDEYSRLLTTRIGTLSPELIAAWQELTALQNRFRYGAETASEADVSAANSAARAIETALKAIDRKALKQALATPTNPQPA